MALIFAVQPAQAHKPSDSYLGITIQQDRIQGHWDIALRDLDYAIGLDNNDDGLITWGEVQSRHDAISAYALSRLQIRGYNPDGNIHSGSEGQKPGNWEGGYLANFCGLCTGGVQTGSLAIIAIASVWLVDRVFEIQLITY